MLMVSGLGHKVVDHLSDLLEIVVTLDDEAVKDGKGECDDRLHQNTAIHIVHVSVNTPEIVLESQTCKTPCTVNPIARPNLNWKIRM